LAAAASSACSSTTGAYCFTLVPTDASLGCSAASATKGSGAPASVKGTRPSLSSAVYRCAFGSTTFLLKFHSLSHSIRLEFFDAPIDRMKFFSPATVMPRRRMPPTVGKRGSSQPSALPWSMIHCSLRFESSVRTKLMREKPHRCTSRSLRLTMNHWYCASRSEYCRSRSACVTPSIESTIGHARSYVG